MTTTPPLDVGGTRELFLDDFLLEESRGLSFRVHSPVELPADPGKPAGHYCTILHDGTQYRYYYRGFDGVFTGPQNNGNPGEFTAVALSDDGLCWHQPDWTLLRGEGLPSGTIFHGNGFAHNFVPFYDTSPACSPEERYKAVAGVRETNGLFAFFSPDGIHWRHYDDSRPVIAYEPANYGRHLLDSQNVVFYSECERCYVMYPRVWKTADGRERIRSFAKTTSTDFRHWSKVEFLDVNRPDEHLYTSGLRPYPRAPHYYIGAATRYFEERGSATDVVLLFSRRGQGIGRPSPAAWIRPGLDPDRWSNRCNYIAWGMVQYSPEKLLLYHGPRKLMYELRTDGFVSLSAGIAEGTATTRILTRKSGGDLSLNLSTSAGGAFALEVASPDGIPIPGFSFADFPAFYGDRIAFTPVWNNGRHFSELPPGDFRLRVRMSECDLYSINF